MTTQEQRVQDEALYHSMKATANLLSHRLRFDGTGNQFAEDLWAALEAYCLQLEPTIMQDVDV